MNDMNQALLIISVALVVSITLIMKFKYNIQFHIFWFGRSED